jgi:hypothetical protein
MILENCLFIDSCILSLKLHSVSSVGSDIHKNASAVICSYCACKI